LAEALAVLVGCDEGLNHLGGDEVAVEAVEFGKPEVESVFVGSRRALTAGRRA